MRKSIIRAISPLFLTVIFPFLADSQLPVMKIDQKEDPAVGLHKLQVDIKITGSLSVTTLQMTFKNSSSRILEGELTIPLPEGASVSRYALDINGRMREAVPVNKAKGTQVFEAIERRRVDPGLLEKVDGNNFRTRIYPIPAQGSRQIIIAYEQELTLNKRNELRYFLPMNYQKPIPEFSLDAAVIKSMVDPMIESNPGDLSFKEWNQNFTASIKKTNYHARQSLSIVLPKQESIPELMMQQKEDGYYFLVNLYKKGESIKKDKIQSMAILWDVSLSSVDRDLQKELDLLNEYFKKQPNLTVQLLAFNNYSRKLKEYRIEKGNWETLKKDILGFTYDGGTNYSKIIFPPCDEYLLFTDGLQGLSNSEINTPSKRVYTISSSPKSDFSYLKWIAQKTSASFVNLNSTTPAEAIRLINEQSLQIIGYKKTESVEEVYPSIPTDLTNCGSIAGLSRSSNASITVLLGYGNTVVEEKIIQLKAGEFSNEAINLEKIWAQKKINELDIQYERNKIEIERLGNTYGIVTRNTSLIVLETINDYLLYEIEPPEELRNEYDRIMKQRNQFTQRQEKTIYSNASFFVNMLREWYGEQVDKENTLAPVPIQRDQSIQADSSSVTIPPRNQNSRQDDQTNNISHLEEVVVTGYSTSRRRDLTYSVTTVNDKDLSKAPNLQSALAGKVSGVQIVSPNSSQPNQDTQIRMRGVSSLSGSTPQIILNGRPSSWDEVQYLDPSDIESIIVQKTGYYIPTTTNRTNFYFNRPDPSLPKINWHKLKWMAKDGKANFQQKTFTTREHYINQLENCPESLRYEKYLTIRNGFMRSPVFYFNVATWFFENDDYETGLTILQNLGELDLQNHELYKMLGYKMKELGEYELALAAFRKVLEWRPMEPQSYRDYGLALQDAGYHQQALDTLCLALSRNYAADVTGLYRGIEEMIITEINQLVSVKKGLVLPKNFDHSLILNMPLDIRVVANWNMNDTDIDLWVTDPVGEKCYFSHKNTQLGGRISNDFTRGYGPEQFLLKKAAKGKYKVHINFYAQSSVKIVGNTTVQVEVFIHYGSNQQQRQVVTCQTAQQGRNVVLVGEFDIK